MKQAELGCLRAFFGPSTLFLNRHVGATIVPWSLSYLQELKLLALNQCQLSTDSPSVQLTGEAAIQFSIATKKMYQPASYLIRFSSSGHCWKHLLLRDTLVFNIRHETTEWQMFNVHQRWHCALGQEPLSQHFGQLWTPAISPFLVSFSKPKHFQLVRNKLFPIIDVFSVKIGRTTTLRRLFKVINFGRSKFVCTLWPCPVFGMRAAGLATHLTTPVCPVARTQTIINTKTIGNRKRDCAWGCARRINTTWENLQIEKHKSGRRSFRSPDWFVLFDLQISQVVFILRAQPHAQSLFYFQ